MIPVSHANQHWKSCQHNLLEVFAHFQTHHVDNVQLPVQSLQSNRIDKLVERRPGSGESLRQSDTLGTMHKGKDLGDVNVGHWVHDGVEHVVDKDHGHDGAGCPWILGLGVVGTGACPACEEDGHAAERDQVLSSALEFAGQQGRRAAGDEVPARESEVDKVLGSLICDTDGVEDLGQVAGQRVRMLCDC